MTTDTRQEQALRDGLHSLATEAPPPDLSDRLITAVTEFDGRSTKRSWLPIAAAAACVAVIAIGVAVVARPASAPQPAASPRASTSAHCVSGLPAGPAPHAGGLTLAPTGVDSFWNPGLNAANRCIEQVTGSAALAREFVAALATATPVATPQAVNCPADDGTSVLLRFSFASPGVASVSVALSGCRFAALPDGSTVSPPAAFFTLLDQLAPPDPAPSPSGSFRTFEVPSGTTASCYAVDPGEEASPGPLGPSPIRIDATWQPGTNAADCREPVTQGNSVLARELAADLAQAPLRPPDGTSCPSDDGAGALLYFSFGPTLPPATVYVKLAGCEFAIRPDGRSVRPGADFYAALAQLAPPNMRSRLP